jgi:hypothetical protein
VGGVAPSYRGFRGTVALTDRVSGRVGRCAGVGYAEFVSVFDPDGIQWELRAAESE